MICDASCSCVQIPRTWAWQDASGFTQYLPDISLVDLAVGRYTSLIPDLSGLQLSDLVSWFSQPAELVALFSAHHRLLAAVFVEQTLGPAIKQYKELQEDVKQLSRAQSELADLRFQSPYAILLSSLESRIQGLQQRIGARIQEIQRLQ
jgi:hypothetical protein